MTAVVHYAGRRVVGKHVIGSPSPLCGVRGVRAKLTGHDLGVTCKRCQGHLRLGRAFLVGDKPSTISEAIDKAGVTSVARFHVLLSRVQYKAWRFNLRLDGGRPYLQVAFDASDSITADAGSFAGRKWLLSPHMTDSEVIATAFKAVLTAEEHECREAFRYRGQPIFGPHLDVDWLADSMAERDVTSVRAERKP